MYIVSLISISLLLVLFFVLIKQKPEKDKDTVITFRNGKVGLENVNKRNINSNNLYTIKGCTEYFNRGIIKYR